MLRKLLFLVLASVLLVALVGCGGKGAASGNEAKSAADADPLVLFPAGPIAVVGVDARAMYASAPVASALAPFTDSMVALGDEAGFQPARDLDRILVASYASNEADVAVVLVGRFDPARIAAATRTRTGAPLAKGSYAGFATQTAGSVTIVPLTARTLVAGTTERVHRVLDRLAPATPAPLERAVAPWVGETLGTPGAQIAVTADFANEPVASATIGSINLPWLKGLRVVRAIGDFDAPGLNVAATLTYGDPGEAQNATDGMRLIDGWQKLLAPLLLGARVENLQVGSTGNDVSCKFAVDSSSLSALLGLASRYFNPPPP